MRTIGLPAGLVMLLLAIATWPVAAQTYSCRPATETTDVVNLKDYVVRLAGGDGSLDSTRQIYRLPVASAPEVQVVTQVKTCKDAAHAHHTAVRGPSAPAMSRSIVVIKVGNSRYVVLDPAEGAGEYEITVIFNSSFQPLASFDS
jgi:hypothetical protein